MIGFECNGNSDSTIGLSLHSLPLFATALVLQFLKKKQKYVLWLQYWVIQDFFFWFDVWHVYDVSCFDYRNMCCLSLITLDVLTFQKLIQSQWACWSCLVASISPPGIIKHDCSSIHYSRIYSPSKKPPLSETQNDVIFENQSTNHVIVTTMCSHL